MSFLIWNPAENSDELNSRWGRLRALEWSAWPLFISQALAPILLLFVPWVEVLIGVVLANLLWAGVHHRFVSVAIASLSVHFVMLKWVICPATAAYLYFDGQITAAVLALLWPLVVLVVPGVPGARLGTIEGLFMRKLGYAPAHT